MSWCSPPLASLCAALYLSPHHCTILKRKQAALAALFLATALATIYATQPVSEKITAHEFALVDSSGKVRVRMHTVASGSSEIELYDTEGRSDAGMAAPTEGPPAFWLSDSQDKAAIQMNLAYGVPNVFLEDPQGKPRASMSVSRSGAPRIWLSDPQGFEMNLGNTQTITPATRTTQQTSAASIIMFGNDNEHRVIWQAP